MKWPKRAERCPWTAGEGAGSQAVEQARKRTLLWSPQEAHSPADTLILDSDPQTVREYLFYFKSCA